jgi:5-methylcytosine-specific restriction endonuclease McrA
VNGTIAKRTRPRRDALLRHSSEWFTDGSSKKAEARRRHACVECHAPLPNGRTPYCGRKCQWRFRGHYFWDAARTYVLHRDRFTCQRCGRRHYVRDLEVDHVIEIAAGGPALDYANLQTVCRRCHRAKTVQFLRARGHVATPDPDEPEGVSTRWTLAWFPA